MPRPQKKARQWKIAGLLDSLLAEHSALPLDAEESGKSGEAEGFADIEPGNALVEAHATLADRGAPYPALPETHGNSTPAEVQVENTGDNRDAGIHRRAAVAVAGASAVIVIRFREHNG